MEINNWQDLDVENPVIRPINIRKFLFSDTTRWSVDKQDTVNIKATLIDDKGRVEETPITRVSSLERGMYSCPSAVKFELKDDFGMEFGVGIIFEMKRIAL
jgi:hypothetical protein